MKNWGMKTKPLVSIGCITYNHENYIEEAIQSFLMQETNFPFEIIIHDDASTDNTAKIIAKYFKAYPKIIKPIFQKENQHSKTNVLIYPKFVYPNCKGKYIALCEGDDYWTDSLKLKKQVAAMEARPECSWCFHPAAIVRKSIETNRVLRINSGDKIFDDSSIFKINNAKYSPTASLLLKSSSLQNSPEWIYESPVGDLPLKLFLTLKGSAYYLDIAMSAYRSDSAESFTSGYKSSSHTRNKLYIGLIKMYMNFNRYTKLKYASEVYYRIAMYLGKLMRTQPLNIRLHFLFKIMSNKELRKILPIKMKVRIFAMTLAPLMSKIMLRIKFLTNYKINFERIS